MRRKERKNRQGGKEWDDDDGRTIADMSQIGDPGISGLFTFRSPPGDERNRTGGTKENSGALSDSGEGSGRSARPWEEPFQMTGKERFYYVLGAFKAVFLIGLAFMAGLGLVIFLLMKLWT